MATKTERLGKVGADSMQKHYPDVVAAGGLAPALDLAFEAEASELRCVPAEALPFAYANVCAGSRHSQMMLAAEHGSFSVDFWCRGVQYGHGWASGFDDTVAAIVAFNEKGADVPSMEGRFAWFRDRGGRLHGQGAAAYVEAGWLELLSRLSAKNIDSHKRLLLPLAVKAGKRPELRQLLPFTSLSTLCFSRTTG